tara:strand:- start:1495 stop:1917 length:423 start_codon:yes stop_codon:yes gene_type:complete
MFFNEYYGIFGGLLDFEVLFLTIFVASLLWTFGVHFVKLEEERFLSYLGVSSLAAMSSLVYWFIFGGLLAFLSRESISIAIILYIVSLLLYVPLQIFLNLLFGKIVWKTDWKKSSLVWLVINILLGLGVLVELITSLINL